MSEKKVTPYRLYAISLTDESVKEAASFRFNRINERYAMVYSDVQPRCKCVEIGKQEISRLTVAESQWLESCIIILVKEAFEKKKPETMDKAREIIAALELELEKEQQRLSGKDANADGAGS